MTRVFRKLYPATKVSLSNGKSVQFEDLNGVGFYRTEDPVVIAELDLCMKAGRGGVSNSTQEVYDAEAKKKSNSPPLRVRWNEVQTSGLITKPRAVNEAAVVVTNNVAEIVTPAAAEPVVSHAGVRVGKRK